MSSAAFELVSRSNLSGVAAGVHLRALSPLGSTAGQILDAASPISTGTAAAHLLSIIGVSGTIAASAPSATFAIVAAHGVAGTIAATAPSAVAAIFVAHGVSGTIAATAPATIIQASGLAFQVGFAEPRAPITAAADRSLPQGAIGRPALSIASPRTITAATDRGTPQGATARSALSVASPRAITAAADRETLQSATARPALSVASPRATTAAADRTSFFDADDRVLPPLPAGVLASVSPNATAMMQGSA